MSRIIRSARGKLLDLDLYAIKAQLQSVPAPRHVEDRKRAMDAKDGVKTDQLPDLDFLNVATAAAAASAQAAEEPAKPGPKPRTGSQIQRK